MKNDALLAPPAPAQDSVRLPVLRCGCGAMPMRDVLPQPRRALRIVRRFGMARERAERGSQICGVRGVERLVMVSLAWLANGDYAETLA
jgi:hypothetical protein